MSPGMNSTHALLSVSGTLGLSAYTQTQPLKEDSHLLLTFTYDQKPFNGS